MRASVAVGIEWADAPDVEGAVAETCDRHQPERLMEAEMGMAEGCRHSRKGGWRLHVRTVHRAGRASGVGRSRW